MTNESTLSAKITERLVAGHNIDGPIPFSTVVGIASQPTLLVLLRHYG